MHTYFSISSAVYYVVITVLIIYCYSYNGINGTTKKVSHSVKNNCVLRNFFTTVV